MYHIRVNSMKKMFYEVSYLLDTPVPPLLQERQNLLLVPPGYLGTTPDGIVEQEGTLVKLIEIKCSFSMRYLSVEEIYFIVDQ